MGFALAGRRVFVAGHRGMVGSALVRRLAGEDCEILMVERRDLDLRDQAGVFAWFERARPDAVFLAAARVGGIHANDSLPGDFLYDNLAIETNVIEAARRSAVLKLVFLGSSCIYPRLAPQPMPEDCLLTGPLEPTNQWYAVAKIAGLKLCEAYRRQHGCDFVSVMPTNLYGPGDNFDPVMGHVLPAMIVKFHEAAAEGRDSVTLWGTGRPKREFLHVDDLADAVVALAGRDLPDDLVNIGTGEEVTIAELAALVARHSGFSGEVRFDSSMPDGTPRKLLDVSRLRALGWRPKIALEEGVARTCAWYRETRRADPAALRLGGTGTVTKPPSHSSN